MCSDDLVAVERIARECFDGGRDHVHRLLFVIYIFVRGDLFVIAVEPLEDDEFVSVFEQARVKGK